MIPVVPARGGAEVALGVYRTFLIYRTCMHRAPARPVRACILGKWCPVSHVTFEAPLRTSHSTLHTSHSTLHTSHCTLRTRHFTLHTPHFTVHTSRFSLLSSHSTLHTSHSTLHTSLFTPHSSRPTLHTALFTLHTSPHLSSSHLIPAHLFSSHLFSYVIDAFMNHFPVLLRELACAVRQPGLCVRALYEAVAVLLSKNMACARQGCNATSSKHFPHTSLFTPHAPHFTLALYLNSSHLSSSHLISCLPICQLKFFLAIFLSSERSSTYLISPKLGSTHLGSMESSVNNLSEAYDHLKISFPTRSGRHTSILLILENRLQRLSWKTQKNYVQQRLQLQLQNRSSTPQRKKDDFEALFKRTFKRKIASAKIEKICWQITVAALMQPLQY